MPTSLLPRLLLSCTLLAVGYPLAHAQTPQRDPDATDGAVYVGLPSGGTLDAERVLSARYGSAAASASASASASHSVTAPAPAPAPRARAVTVPGGGITGILVENTGMAAQTALPVSFGQVFAVGDLPRGAGLAGKLTDGTTLPLQLDVKASHPDGSVRHAIISALLPKLALGQALGIALVKTTAPPPPSGSVQVGAAANTQVSVVIDGARYNASADALLKQQKAQVWLHGPVVTELHVATPLRNAQGVAHPHLAARFALRWYAGAQKARVDVSLENNWAYAPDPRNLTYDVHITAGGQTLYEQQQLTHWHHARWRTLGWVGAAPQLHVRHDSAYLIAARALPNYDRSVVPSDAALAALARSWQGVKTAPMAVGLALPGMPTTGGRDDIGLLPGWAALYLLSMDARAKQATLGTADLAGSWSIHYRDQATGLPVSLADYPYMTLLGHKSDTRNPKTGKFEAFPVCAPTLCKNPNNADSAHQPGFAYLPYLVTGDYYYLEELQFWAMYNVFATNPGYRKDRLGLLASHQVRAQAWSLRTLGEAAYISPDAHPLKRELNALVASNLAWYNATYTNNAQANKLGVIVNGPAVVYDNNTGLAPWQDDFFTAAVGHLTELGFKDALPLLKWKSIFPLARMSGAGACWLLAANYSYRVRASAQGPFFDNIGQAYAATLGPERAALRCGSDELAAAVKQKAGDMGGYADSATGFPSNLQPALAYTADANGAAGQRAWARFMSRSVKPDYSKSPPFAIVPR